MIYNLSEFISSNTSITPITNGFSADIIGEQVFLTQTGGDDNSRGLKVDYSVQFISQSDSRVKAYTLIKEVYDFLKNRFGITFPEVTVDSIVYPAVNIGQILPNQAPGYLGVDDNGLHQWSVNFQITIRED